MEEGAHQGVSSGEELIPKSVIRELERQIKYLERILSKKTLKKRDSQGSYEACSRKKTDLGTALAEKRKFSIRSIAEVLKVARSSLISRLSKQIPRPAKYQKAEDKCFLTSRK